VPVIDELLPQHVDLIRCLSYEVEAIKPEQEIYDWIVRESGIPADQTLFVGDTRSADHVGPLKYGFRALHLVRHQPPKAAQLFLGGNPGPTMRRPAT
jgi:FMN phosphatase YigB (HAD superfamily)